VSPGLALLLLAVVCLADVAVRIWHLRPRTASVIA
jgi:hypothetical protein